MDLVARLAQLETDLGKAVRLNEKAAADMQRKWDAAGKAVSSALGALGGAAALTGMVHMVGKINDGIDALNDFADATGTTIEAASQLEDLALRTGTSLDVAQTAVTKLNKALSEKVDSDSAKVLAAIGLSVEDLKRLDPAEALQKVAQALGQYGNDGNKARIVQELFGKSLKEVAPLLKDLAENGYRAATVTSKQADEAERLNKQLFELKKNTLDVARSLVTDLVPALSSAMGMMAKLMAGPGLVQAAKETLKGNTFRSAADGATYYSVELGKVNRELEAIASGSKPGKSIYGADRIAPLKDEQARLEKLARYYQAIQDGVGGGRGSGISNESSTTAPDVSSILAKEGKTPKGPKAAKIVTPDIPREFLDAAEQARESLAKMIDDTPGQKAEALQEKLKQLKVLAEAGLDPKIVTELRTALVGLDTVELPEDVKSLREELDKLFDDSKQGKVDRYNALLAEANLQFDAGAMSAEKFWSVTDKINAEMAKLDKTMEAKPSEWTVFWEQAAKNVQDVLGDGLYQMLDGKFDDIGKSFGRMLKQMAAQAAAAQIMGSLLQLFGVSGGGSGAGVVSSGGGIRSSGNRAMGGPVGSSKLYEVAEGGMPELLSVGNRTLLMMGNQSGMVSPIGGKARASSSVSSAPVNVNLNMTVGENVSRAEVMQIADQARRAAIAGVQEARSRRGQD